MNEKDKYIQERYRKSLAMLAEVMEPMNDVAMAQSKFRCPYRNKDDLCTAKFGCRNQRKPKVKGLFVCALKDNDNLDYRSFWEMPEC